MIIVAEIEDLEVYNKAMFKTRLISGIIMVIIAYGSISRNGIYLAIMLLLLSMIGMGELYKIESSADPIIFCIACATSIAYYAILYLNGFSISLLTPIVIGFLVMAFVFVIKYPKLELHEITLGCMIIIYIPVMLSFIYSLRNTENGIISVWLIFLGAWGADTCAYCAGMLFGKHKMAPVLSPKKSVEGAIGGILGSALLSLAYAMIFNRLGYLDSKFIYIYPIAAFFAAIISIFGDLFASAIKRKYGIKDYGKLIPGHGGVLDRFDSIIFVAPIIYYVLDGLKIVF